MEKDNNLQIMKFGVLNFLRELGGAVRNGRPVLVEDLEEYIDPAIDPILLKQQFKTDGGLKSIRLGDSNIDYDDNFKFYMTTKMPNPHYLPEVCIKVTIINFTVTFQGLEEQMLGDVVIQEKPEIEKQRDEIVVTMDHDQRTLKEIENTILKLLSDSTEEQILDEDTLIDVLDNSKTTSKIINERMVKSLEVEEMIN
jgi:dynein heavy chain